MTAWPLTVRERSGDGVDVVSLGENSLDFVGRGALSGLASKTTLHAFHRLVGGQAATAAVGCARQGWSVRYVGSFGTDEWAPDIANALGREHVEVIQIQRDRTRSRVAMILVDDATGERAVFEFQDPASRLGAGDLPEHVIRSGRVLLLDGTHPDASMRAAAVARAASIPVMVDVDQVHATPGDLLALVDVLVVPESFATAWTGRAEAGAAIDALVREFNAAAAVVTMGADGSLARIGGAEIRTPGCRVPVVDTTGAGDAFRAGLASGWLRYGRAATAEAVLAWANATAALSCRAMGAQGGLPSREDVEAFVTRPPHVRSN